MKQILVLLCFSPIGSFSQKLIKNSTDDFTKMHVKETSWETLKSDFHRTIYFKFKKIDSTSFLYLKISFGGSVFSIEKGADLMLKDEADSIINLQNLKYTITSTGGGARGYLGSAGQGLEACYPIDTYEITALLTKKISKIRYYMQDGYDEFEIKKSEAESLQQSLRLVQ